VPDRNERCRRGGIDVGRVVGACRVRQRVPRERRRRRRVKNVGAVSVVGHGGYHREGPGEVPEVHVVLHVRCLPRSATRDVMVDNLPSVHVLNLGCEVRDLWSMVYGRS